jgi:hypothetical protein
MPRKLPARLRLRVPCGATRTNGETCRAWAIHGGTVCATHGGRAPQVREAALRRLDVLERLLYWTQDDVIAELLDDPDMPTVLHAVGRAELPGVLVDL